MVNEGTHVFYYRWHLPQGENLGSESQAMPPMRTPPGVLQSGRSLPESVFHSPVSGEAGRTYSALPKLQTDVSRSIFRGPCRAHIRALNMFPLRRSPNNGLCLLPVLRQSAVSGSPLCPRTRCLNITSISKMVRYANVDKPLEYDRTQGAGTARRSGFAGNTLEYGQHWSHVSGHRCETPSDRAPGIFTGKQGGQTGRSRLLGRCSGFRVGDI